MLKVKHFTLLSLKIEKRREFLPRLPEKSDDLVSRLSLILTKIWFWNASNFRALTLILIELWPFSPHNL